ncbi:MAG: alpha/beta hydrolase [Deltaproteobacteria bacterium]|nr:alpha/beta hydrolase [Deltaproteobacteria bacterium]
MLFSAIKRKVRRLARRASNWTTIAGLTLRGNTIKKDSRLKNCKNPVLMIYGFGATQRTLSILETRLKNAGYTTFSLNLGGFFGTFNTSSVEESAKYIKTKIEKLYKKFNIQGRLNIIGHSKGGLIGQYYIKCLDGAKRVRTFITIGSPHNGTPWAFAASLTPLVLVCKSLKQMSPYNSFVNNLKQKKFPAHIKVYSIYSKDDTVCPFPMAVLEEAENVKNVEVFGVTHSEMLIKKIVFNSIIHALQDKMPESWEKVSRKNYEEYLNRKKFSKKLFNKLPAFL